MSGTIALTKFASDCEDAYALRKQTYLGKVTTKGEVHGEIYKFIINQQPTRVQERMSNGDLIVKPFRQSTQDCHLKEYGMIEKKIKFEYDTASTPVQQGMTKDLLDSMNLTIRDQIQERLLSSNNYYQASQATPVTFSLDIAMDWQREVEDEIGDDDDGNVFMEISTKSWNVLMKNKEFASSDYVSDQPYMQKKARSMRDWNGAIWCRNKSLDGRNTAAAKLIGFHKSAIGFANVGASQEEGAMVNTGYNQENHYHWANIIASHGSVLIHGGQGVRILGVNEA